MMYVFNILRAIKGWESRKVAKKLGISRSYYSQVSNGRKPSKKLARKICKLYKIKPQLPI